MSAAKKLSRLTGPLASLPDGLYEATARVLADMARLPRITSKMKPAALEQAKEATSRSSQEWRDLQEMARRVLSNGERSVMSVSDFRGAVWKTRQWKVFKAADSRIIQQTEKYREAKSEYDAVCYQMKKAGVLPQHRAIEALFRARGALQKAYERPEVYGATDRQRLVSVLEKTVARVNEVGQICHCTREPRPVEACGRACPARTPLDFSAVIQGCREAARDTSSQGSEPSNDVEPWEEVDQDYGIGLFEPYRPAPDDDEVSSRPVWYGERDSEYDPDEDQYEEDEDDDED